jgi:hypothetical protein
MNCTAAQRRLLADERPDQPASEVRRHLAECPACRAWNRRLLLAERQLSLLAVPPSSAKADLLRKILKPAGAERGRPAPVVRPRALPSASSLKERALRKMSLAFAIAAVLAVVALGLWTVPRQTPAPVPVPVTQEVRDLRVRRDQIVAVRAPRERVTKLADFAAELQDRARTLARAGDADKLADLATFYAELVDEDLVKQARAVPAEERRAVVAAAADRLVRAESEFTRMASETPRAAAALHDLALAARDGNGRLQALLRGEPA